MIGGEPADPLEPATPEAGVGRRVVSGGLALGGRTLALQLVQLASSVLIARLLLPGEYAAFAMAASLIGFGAHIGDLGAQTYFTVARDRMRRPLADGAALAYVTAALTSLLVAGIGIALPTLGNTPGQTAALTAALAASLAVDSLRFGPLVRLRRDLRFTTIGAVTLAESVALYAVQIGLLVAGVGVWSLIVGLWTRSIVSAVLFARLGGGVARPSGLSGATGVLRRSFTFHVPYVLSSGAYFVGAALVATQLDAHEIGLWAWSTVLSAPVVGLVFALQTIMGPSLAAMGGGERSREAAALAGRVAMLLTAAACGVLVGAAAPLIAHVYGPRWLPAVDAARIALIAPMLTALVLTLAPTLETSGRQRIRMWASVVGAVVGGVAAAPLAAAGGVTGAAIATGVVAITVEVAVLIATAHVRVLRTVVDGVVVFGGTVLVTALVAPADAGVGALVAGIVAGGGAALVLIAAADLAALRRLVALRPRRGTVPPEAADAR